MNREFLWILTDIGATYVRMVAYDPIRNEQNYDSVGLVKDYPSFEQALQGYMTKHDIQAKGLAIAIACPIFGDFVQMTNHTWEFSQKELKATFKLDTCFVINDQEAAAQAIPELPDSSVKPIGPILNRPPLKPKGLIAPGSGLGTAGLFPTGTSWKAFASEGGHVSLLGTEDPNLFAILKSTFGHVSAERLISGHGIVNLYCAFYELEHKASPNREGISASSLAGTYPSDPLARKTIDYFTHFLGSFAGNFALTLGALGGIYFTGGALKSLGTSFNSQVFRQAFEDKGRFTPYLQRIPTFMVTHPNLALYGLQHLVAKQLETGNDYT